MDISRNDITVELEKIVRSFNAGLAEWAKTHGCVATFQWGYTPEGGKSIEISSIDMIIYRKEPPSPRVIKSTLDKVLSNPEA